MNPVSTSTSEWRDEYYTNMPAVSSSSGAPMSEPCALGIDEAGRGPVLGPLVYGCCWSAVASSEALKRVGFADSKVLKESARDALFDRIANGGAEEDGVAIGWRVHVSAPEELSNKMLRINNYNLNAISHDACMWLVQSVIDDGVNVAELYVDTVGDPVKYQAKLQARFPAVRVVVSKKADSLFAIVSAASICAKVTRDRLLKHWHFRELALHPSNKLGTGYPGDPTTKKWLAANCDPIFGFPSIVRFSWKTTSKMLDDSCVRAQFPELWDEHDEAASFKARAAVWRDRQQFFAEHDMNLCDDF